MHYSKLLAEYAFADSVKKYFKANDSAVIIITKFVCIKFAKSLQTLSFNA